MRILANLFADLLIWSSGTWVGAPKDRNTDHDKPDPVSERKPACTDADPDED